MHAATQIAATILGPFMALSGISASSTAHVLPQPSDAPRSCIAIDHNLAPSMRDDAVVALQDFLRAEGYFTLTSSGYYGDATKAAVIAFQKDTGIIPTGFVGVKTRAAIEIVCSQHADPSATVSDSPVSIISITPATSTLGSLIVVTGSGFTNDNTVRFGPVTISHVTIASSIVSACTTDAACAQDTRQTLLFTVPVSIDQSCVGFVCKAGSRSLTPGSYDISIENEHGTSTPISFTVTSSS